MQFLKQLALAIVVLHLAACSSMQPMVIDDLRDPHRDPSLDIGDRVEVITHDSEKLEFSVTEIDTNGLGGKFGFIPYENMRRLRVQQAGAQAEDFQWVWVAVGIAALVALIASADSVTACSPGPCPSN